MEFEWDEAKDVVNRAKHGLSLAEAVRLDWATGLIEPDLRVDYGEVRNQILAQIGGRVHVCIYTVRGSRYRVISIRKANPREAARYEVSRER